MNQIRIAVNVPIKAAIAAGRSSYGETTVALSDADIAAMSPEVRAAIVDATERDGALCVYGRFISVAEATAAALVASIEEMCAARRAAAEREAVAGEERIVAALARPLDAWIRGEHSGGEPSLLSQPTGAYVRYGEREDPRMLARLAEAREHALPVAVAAWRSKEAERAAEKAAEAERAAVVPRERNAWIVSRSDLPANVRRAAGESRDTRVALSGIVRERVRTVLDTIGETVVDEVYATRERDDVPTDRAYAVLDALTAAPLAVASMLPDVAVTIDPIARHDIDPRRGRTRYRTGIEVTIAHPWIDPQTWCVLCEYDEDEDEDGDD